MITCTGLYTKWNQNVPPDLEEFKTVDKTRRNRVILPVIVDRSGYLSVDFLVDGKQVLTQNTDIKGSRVNAVYPITFEYPKEAVYRTKGNHVIDVHARLYARPTKDVLMEEEQILSGWTVVVDA